MKCKKLCFSITCLFLVFGALILPEGVLAAYASGGTAAVRVIESTSSHFRPVGPAVTDDTMTPSAVHVRSSQSYDQCSLDVDQDGVINALTDGLLIQRYLLGDRGADLVDGALGVNALRTDPQEIVNFLNSDLCQSMLDVNNSGDISADRDGLLLLRYMFGYSGDNLVNGIDFPMEARRLEAESIRAWLSMHRSPASHIRLLAPELTTALLSGIPASFQVGVEYTGRGEVRVHLLDRPQGMEISSRSGRISWIPSPVHEGQDVMIRISATDGDAYATLDFTVRVAQPRPVQTSQTQANDGRTKITVTEDTGNLQGLDVFLPEQVSSAGRVMSSSDMAASMLGTGLSIVDEADVDVDAIRDGVIRLTDFFQVEPLMTERSSWIEIIFPELNLPSGRYPFELRLYTYSRPLDTDISVWRPMSLNIKQIDNNRISILTSTTGEVSFIGLRERLSTIDSSQIMQWQNRGTVEEIVLNNGQSVTVNCDKHAEGDVLYNNIDVCSTSFNNTNFMFKIEDFHDENDNIHPRWNPTPQNAHEIVGWLLDSVHKFNEFGLAYNTFENGSLNYDINVLITDLCFKDEEGNPRVSNGQIGGDDWYTIRLNSYQGDDCPQWAQAGRTMNATTAHEYFHHAQYMTGNIFYGGNHYSRHWMYEGTAKWFEDEVFDADNSYLTWTPVPRILDAGLHAEFKDELKTPECGYSRYAFFKMLHKARTSEGEDSIGCNLRDTFLPQLFDGHRGNHGATRMIAVLDDQNHSCDFGDVFGNDNRNSIATALEYYTYATQIEQDRRLIDHNEPPGLKFKPSDKSISVVRSGGIVKQTLPPLSSIVYKISDNIFFPGLNQRRLRYSVVDGPHIKLTIRDNNGNHHRSLYTDDAQEYIFELQGISNAVNRWYITLVNDNLDQTSKIQFQILKTGDDFGEAIVSIEEPLQDQIIDNRVTNIKGTVQSEDAFGVRVRVPEMSYNATLPLDNGSFNGMIPIAKSVNTITVTPINAEEMGIPSQGGVVSVTGQEHLNPATRNALIESQMVFSLTWDQPRDMDIHVTDPHGRKIWYNNRSVQDTQGFTYGRLDHDNIPGFGPSAANSPEVLTYFSDMNRNDDMSGCYNIQLHYFSSSGPATNLTLDMLLNENQPGERRGHRVPVTLTSPRSWSQSIYVHCQNTSEGRMVCQRDQDFCEQQAQQTGFFFHDNILPDKD